MKIDITGKCSRCGQPHYQLEFKSFIAPQKRYTHWAICPATEEPILMFVLQPSLRAWIWHSIQWIGYGIEWIWWKVFK
jgi:hypothetical protein